MVNKALAWTIGIILAILIIGGIVAGIIFIPSGTTQASAGSSSCSGGSSILGISNARITTSSDLGGKEVIRVTAVANGGGECLTISWSESELENKLGEGYTVDDGVFGSLTTKSQTQTFTSSKNIEPVFKMGKNEKQEGTLCTISNCERTYPSTIYAARKFIGFPCWCIHKNLIGSGGQMDSGQQRDFEVEFGIDGLGDITLTDAQQSGRIGSKAFIKWSGDLMSNNWLGRPNYDSFLRVSDNNWRLTRDGFYSDISDRLETDSSSSGCLNPTTKGLDAVDGCIGNYNSFVDLNIANKNIEFKNRENIVKDIEWDGNKLITDLDTFTTWQIFTIDLDAEFVGIHKNVGRPNVRCPSGKQEFVSGSRATTIVEVKDLSGTNPSFNLAYECGEGSGSIAQSRINNVGSSFRNIEVFATESTTTEKDILCTFTAKDLNNPSNKDSCNVEYTVKPFTGCTPGEKQCSSDGGKLLTCNSAGNNFNEVDCDFGCEAFENTFRCRLQAREICDNGIDDDGDGLIDLDDPNCKEKECDAWLEIGGKTIIPDLFCIINNFIESFKWVFAIVAGLLGGLIGLLFGIKLIPREINNRWAYLLGIFVVLSIAIGIVAFIYFWWVILALIIFGLIKLLVPGV